MSLISLGQNQNIRRLVTVLISRSVLLSENSNDSWVGMIPTSSVGRTIRYAVLLSAQLQRTTVIKSYLNHMVKNVVCFWYNTYFETYNKNYIWNFLFCKNLHVFLTNTPLITIFNEFGEMEASRYSVRFLKSITQKCLDRFLKLKHQTIRNF